MRILLVEGDHMIGEGLSQVLAAEGVSVDWVCDGGNAEAALRDRGHAIVLLDLELPGAEGLRLLKAARRQGIDTPVLIITARDGLVAVPSLRLGHALGPRGPGTGSPEVA